MISGLSGFGFAKLYPKELHYTAIIGGGLMLGVGLPCRALVPVQLSRRPAREPQIQAQLLTGGAGKLTFVDLTGLPFWQIALPFAVAIEVLLYAIERGSPWREELGENADGYFPASRNRGG